MTTTVVNGRQGRKKIAEAETVRIHRGWLGSVAVSDGSQSMSDPLRTVLVRRPDASFGGAERRRQFCQTVDSEEAGSIDGTRYEENGHRPPWRRPSGIRQTTKTC